MYFDLLLYNCIRVRGEYFATGLYEIVPPWGRFSVQGVWDGGGVETFCICTY